MQHNGVWSSFTLEWSTPHVNERTVVGCGDRAPTYEVSKADRFAYSCLYNQRIVYHVEKYGQTRRVGASDATETVELNINYPAAQRAFWDPIVAHMSRSLRIQTQ